MIPIQNQQQTLAQEFNANDILLAKANYEAILRIKRWKFIHGLSVLNKNIRKEADNMICKSFLSFINNDEVLELEGYFHAELQN